METAFTCKEFLLETYINHQMCYSLAVCSHKYQQQDANYLILIFTIASKIYYEYSHQWTL